MVEPLPLLAEIPTYMWLQHLPWAIFIFAFGACVGSFLNVVMYRLPLGMSVISPPSRCPTCGATLKFFGENLPIIGWFLIRGRCRYCGVRVSARYMIIELFMALLFLGLYLLYFVVEPSTPWLGAIGGAWWHTNGMRGAWPAFAVMACLLTGLIAMTVIDARTFTIPIQLPLVVTWTAFIGYPVLALWPYRRSAAPFALWNPPYDWPIYGVNWLWFAIALGGVLGILVTTILLKLGWLRYSFEDYDEYVNEDEVLAGEYPHARREMLVELRFLLPCIAGMALGWFVGRQVPAGPTPEFVQAVGGTLLGYLVGGGIIWTVRILGTLAFGREAMGMGDVHLLAAVGACLGWFDMILIMPFLAPFSGLLWALVSMTAGAAFRRRWAELPFGPHLAVATFMVIFLRPGIERVWAVLLEGVPMPARGFV